VPLLVSSIQTRTVPVISSAFFPLHNVNTLAAGGAATLKQANNAAAGRAEMVA